ncbi:MAG: hypothetical protein PHW79_10165 [Candidatus Marinimicrobia bacterium]|nr:hypothetical protein [Candidatus Neomarinimicrobiota bacterium]
MKKISIIAICSLCAVFFLFLNCDNNKVDEPDDTLPDLILVVDDSSEAFELALFMDRTLLPSQKTYDFQLHHIKYLRQTWSDSLPFLGSNRFLTPWVIDHVAVKFDSVTADSIRSGRYRGFEMLPDSMEVPDDLGWTQLYYDEKYNPVALSEIISGLPGVVYAEPDRRMFTAIIVRPYPVLPGLINENAAYIIAEHQLSPTEHYFRYENGEPKYFGIVSSITDSLILAEVESVRSQFTERSRVSE